VVNKAEADVTVTNEGTIFLFMLNTKAAHEWVSENVQLEGYQWMSKDAFTCEHRYAYNLTKGMQDGGLSVN
jgi:hypothetical protein